MSGFRRFFVDAVTDLTVIEGEEFTHAVSVLRIKQGENIYVCDNAGNQYLAIVQEIKKKNLIAKIIERTPNECEAQTEVTLVCGYLKGDKTELVVQKATELGVKNIVIFSSEFSSAYINDNKLNRLKRVAVEACKQCGRSKVPTIEYAERLDLALDKCQNVDNKLFACEFANKNEVSFNCLKGNTAIVVGSEGGFSEKEYKTALEKGFSTVYLGKRILRAETASISLLSIIMFSLGEMN